MKDEKGRFIKGKMDSEIVEKRNATRKLNGWHTENSKKNISMGQLKNKELIEKRKEIAKKMGLGNKGKKKSEEAIQSDRKASLKKWDNLEYKNSTVRKIASGNTHCPNTKELFLDSLIDENFPNEYLFNAKSAEVVSAVKFQIGLI